MQVSSLHLQDMYSMAPTRSLHDVRKIKYRNDRLSTYFK
jgi:hypothetical protein